ncbi:MAG: MlaD family protein [Myxococcota bacterium]|nr:MlaD family protein [Myxococcota bacterium]
MSSKTQKIKVGLFVAATGLLLVIVLVTFAGMKFWEGRETYRIVFTKSVMGLEKGARVYLNGVKVGAVEDIQAAKDDLRNVEVTIAVKEGTPIRKNTEAMLQLAGITGLKVIDLRNGTLDAPVIPEGSRIAEGETTIDKLSKNAETLADQAAELMTRANKIVGQLEGMDQVVASAKVTADNLAQASGQLSAMVGENRKTLKNSLVAIEETAKSASTLLDGHMSQLVANADSLVSDVKGVVHRNDTALRTAVFDLKQASRTFKELAREVRQRPSRLLFSEPTSERKLP